MAPFKLTFCFMFYDEFILIMLEVLITSKGWDKSDNKIPILKF